MPPVYRRWAVLPALKSKLRAADVFEPVHTWCKENELHNNTHPIKNISNMVHFRLRSSPQIQRQHLN